MSDQSPPPPGPQPGPQPDPQPGPQPGPPPGPQPGFQPGPAPGPPPGWTPGTGWTPPSIPLDALPVAARPSLPVVETDYVQFFRAPRFRWWKPLLAVLGGGAVWLILLIILSVVGIAIDGWDDLVAPDGTPRVGPGMFLVNNLWLAAGIPIAMLTAWAVLGQRPGWLSSVAGGFRWSWFARCCVIVLPIWAVLIGTGYYLGSLDQPIELRWFDYTVFMIITILVTTPLQSAGEEYVVRGLLARCVGAYFANPWVAFGAATVVSSGVFMVLHGAQDPWLNVYYVVFAVVSSWLVWRTGGLEASIAIHVINNVLSMVTVPFSDFSDMFDRSAGTGDPTILANMAVLVGTAVLIDWIARRRGVVRLAAPGREQLASVQSAVARGVRPA